MLGLDGYGSDSDEEASPPIAPSKPKPKKKKIGIPLLPQKVPPPEDDDELDDERPPAKRPRLESGAGVSSLLSMLPAPKRKETGALPSGTGNFTPISSARPASKAQPKIVEEDPILASTDFFSLGKFTLGILSDYSDICIGSTSSSSKASSSVAGTLPKVSAAPSLPTFEPPEPTPTDEYPGYYQLPSGQWAAHDPEYYAKFAKKWQVEYDAHVRALEKGAAKGFENMDDSAVEEVDAQQEMERAKKEVKLREDRKAVTRGAEGAQKLNLKITVMAFEDEYAQKLTIEQASKQSGIARTRHQLATMLNEAYSNREALEEKIAEGRRNRKEAGNKYGGWSLCLGATPSHTADRILNPDAGWYTYDVQLQQNRCFNIHHERTRKKKCRNEPETVYLAAPAENSEQE